MYHPQTSKIENDVSHLHDRWLKDCAIHRDVYDPVDDVELLPRIHWAQVLNEKQKQVNNEVFGPSLADVEKQIASHNILHKEIETYNSQMSPGTTSSKEEYADIKKQYTNLLDNSKWRRHYLSSLYDYMHGCKKEMKYLNEEQAKILKQDWSDRMVDPPDVRREYENFKNNSLLSHEAEVNRLQDDGDRLVELKHPASSIVETQRDELRNEWQKFLNLCICQEVHLDNMEEYKKYQLDADTLSESLTRLSSSLDPKALSSMSNPEILLQLQAEEKAVQRSEAKLADLRKRSTTIAPLKLRRSPPTRAKDIESLCDWTTPKASLTRGNVFTLKSNSDNENWEVVGSDGIAKSFPGVCFLIPPPDTEAIDKVDLLGGELADLKKRRAALEASLKSRPTEVSKASQAAPVSAAPENPKALELAGRLSDLDKDLAQAEEDILSRLRAPLDRTDSAKDLDSRLKEQQKAAEALAALNQQKAAAQKELEPLLSQNTNGPTLSSLPEKLNSTQNKQDSLAALADLYTKKANASLNLENQIKKVDGIVSGLEQKLSEDGAVPDAPDAIPTRLQEVQDLNKDVAKTQPQMKKLSEDLEATEKLCSSLQQGYQEYCPDIGRQRSEVTKLQGRYARVANQGQEREKLLQSAALKNQDFQNVSQSLDSFLNNLPNNNVSPSDSLAEISAKQTSQERVVEDIRRKGDDVDRVIDLSTDLQDLLEEYETNADTFNGTLEDAGPTEAKKPNTSSLADAVQQQEKALANRYAETAAANDQLLNQLGLAKNIVGRNEEQAAVVSQQQAQLQSQLKSAEEVDGLKKELDDEVSRRDHAETDLKTFKDRLLSLKSRRGVERIEEKEVLQYYRDPKMEKDLEELEKTAHEEALKRAGIQSEIDLTGSKITKLTTDTKAIEPKLVTREVTKYERDPQLDIEADKVNSEIKKLKDDSRETDKEVSQLQTELTILEQKKPNIKQRVVQREVVRVEKDPEMLKAVRTFESDIADEGERSRSINNEIFQIRSQINTLERLIPTLEPKIVTKEVKQVEQDPEALKESEHLKSLLDNEQKEYTNLLTELSGLQLRLGQVKELKPKLEVKEVVSEIFKVSPQTEEEMARLKRERQDSVKKNKDLEYEIRRVKSDIEDLKTQPPQVEWKEVTQEVVKEERTPEDVKELQKLADQLSVLQNTYDTTENQIKILKKDRDEIKAEKSKVETKLLNKEVVKYIDDPLLEKEADRLRRDYRDEQQKRRAIEEMVFDLQQKYIELERQKPEEKVVVEEVVKVQKNPQQLLEHDRLGKDLDTQLKSRRQLELEVNQLKSRVEEKERNVRASDERKRKNQVETELSEVKTRIRSLETAPPPVEESIVMEEVMKVERDPKLEKLTSGLRTDFDRENNEIIRLQREIRHLNARLDVLKREKAGEKTVYKEVIRVEKDQAVESERSHLRDQALQQRNARRDLEDEIKKLKEKLSRLRNRSTSTSQEETNLVRNRDSLQKEKDRLERELRTLESEKQDTAISFQQQTRLMSDRNQMNRQKSIKMETDVQRLERDILDEKDKIHKRENTVRELQNSLKKEGDQKESRTKETNLSTKITILDPDTGKDMSPYDAFLKGMIDRKQYLQLQELECDWEQVSTMGPDGETSVLQDRKSGKQYPIKEALKDGRVTEEQLDQFKKGKMPISEFALLVAGETKPAPSISSIPSWRSRSSTSDTVIEGDFPISGIYDNNTDSSLSIRDAMKHRMIDTNTAQKLLEAQAATGGIVDINNRERYSVHKAAELGLIEASQLQRLLNAQKAYTGVEDPITRERLSIGEAVQKGWMPKDTAMRYMEAQFLTGGLVNPNRTGRVDVIEAVGSKMIDSAMLRELQEEANHAKELIDPITKEKINYKQALNRSKVDPASRLPMLPATSKSTSPSSSLPSYYTHRSSIR
ncbi:envoplakin a isoform X2 [Engraulis encrasicolus]|uniref:envoplakin a isoform X2 n=1 Tax=Engraulis encrasicolus TaxID=184585 RepID=UPI002FCFC109